MTDSKSFKKKLTDHARKYLLFSSPENRYIEEAVEDTEKGLYNGVTTAGTGNAGTDVYMLALYRRE